MQKTHKGQNNLNSEKEQSEYFLISKLTTKFWWHSRKEQADEMVKMSLEINS